MNSKEEAIIKNDYRSRQLMQVWRDYYDEILEINHENGTYISLMSPDEQAAKKGFVEIDLLLLLKQRIHPDDSEAFKSFLDKDRLLAARKAGQRIAKLNFRYRLDDDSFVWVKGKSIIPEYQGEDEFINFLCFRIVDMETNEDLIRKQELLDEIESLKEVSEAKGELLEELSRELRSQLQGIMGMSAIAKMSVRDTVKTTERLEKIEKAAKTMAEQLDRVIEKDRTGFLDERAAAREAALDAMHKGAMLEFGGKSENSKFVGESFEEWKKKLSLEDSEESSTDSASEENDDEEYDFTGRRVLIAENNPLNCEIMVEILEMAGFKAEYARDGKEAVIDFIKNPVGYYDLILMDVELEVIDGVEAAKCIKLSGKDDAESVPIFAVTAHFKADEPKLSATNYFTGVLSKPVDFKFFYRKANKALKTKTEYVVSEY